MVFRPINLLKADNKGIWVYGLGESADIITVGQGFVEYGEQVEPVFVSDDSQQTAEPASDSSVQDNDLTDQTALTAG